MFRHLVTTAIGTYHDPGATGSLTPSAADKKINIGTDVNPAARKAGALTA